MHLLPQGLLLHQLYLQMQLQLPLREPLPLQNVHSLLSIPHGNHSFHDP